jgi:hypothetical protein
MSNNDVQNKRSRANCWVQEHQHRRRGDRGNKAGHNDMYHNEGDGCYHEQSPKYSGAKVPAGINSEGTSNNDGNRKGDDESGWQKVNTRNFGKDKGVKSSKQGGNSMVEHEVLTRNVNVGFIGLRIICGKGFNVARGLREFISAGQGYDKQFAILAMSRDGPDIMQSADAPTSRKGI